jgi:hypothetical protein
MQSSVQKLCIVVNCSRTGGVQEHRRVVYYNNAEYCVAAMQGSYSNNAGSVQHSAEK